MCIRDRTSDGDYVTFSSFAASQGWDSTDDDVPSPDSKWVLKRTFSRTGKSLGDYYVDQYRLKFDPGQIYKPKGLLQLFGLKSTFSM